MIQTISLRLNLKVVSDFIEIKKQFRAIERLPPPPMWTNDIKQVSTSLFFIEKKSTSKQVIKRKEYKTKEKLLMVLTTGRWEIRKKTCGDCLTKFEGWGGDTL